MGYMKNDQEIAERIRELRGDMTQEELAARAGVSTLTVSNIERAVNSPTVTTLNALAGALKVSVMSFFAGDRDAMDAFIKRKLQQGPDSHDLGMAILDFARAAPEVRALASAILSADTSRLDGFEYSDGVRDALEALLKSLKQDR